MSEKPNDEKETHMTTIDADRLELHQAAIDSLGKKPADTLMEHLPPTGWGDVARKQDLDALEKRIDMRFAATKQNLDELEKRIDLQFAATNKDVARIATTLNILIGTLITLSATMIYFLIQLNMNISSLK
jgi:tetrahydromethanopterin S-methyltransferase subunit G